MANRESIEIFLKFYASDYATTVVWGDHRNWMTIVQYQTKIHWALSYGRDTSYEDLPDALRCMFYG